MTPARTERGTCRTNPLRGLAPERLARPRRAVFSSTCGVEGALELCEVTFSFISARTERGACRTNPLRGLSRRSGEAYRGANPGAQARPIETRVKKKSFPSIAEATSGASGALRRDGWRALADRGQIAAVHSDAQARDCIGLHTLPLKTLNLLRSPIRLTPVHEAQLEANNDIDQQHRSSIIITHHHHT